MKPNLLLLALFTTLFLSACQKDKQNNEAPNVGGVSTMQGPSDGGGGDTCNGKMIESYKVDITSLDEFKELVQPILNKIWDQPDSKNNGTPFSLTPTLKSWYFLDCKLQDIPKERKGLYLETYQTAIHTSREIFIDSTSYNKMAKDEKAKLLLHEMIMSYYLMTYLSLEDICKMSGTCSGDFVAANKWKMFKPAVYRALNEEDHQKIRNVTAWLWMQKDALTPDSFSKILKNNDFDKRFEIVSKPEVSVSNEIEIEIDVHALLRMFKKHQWTNSFPKYCQFNSETNLSSSVCQAEIISDIRDYDVSDNVKLKRLYVKVKITRSSDHKVLEQDFSYPLANGSQKIKLYLSKRGSVLSAAPFAMTANWPTQSAVKSEEGLKSQMLFFMLNLSNKGNPEIYQMIYQSYVWYNFEDEITKKDGVTYKETYGYMSILNEESENLFIESELPFTFKPFMQNKNFIKSQMISEIK